MLNKKRIIYRIQVVLLLVLLSTVKVSAESTACFTVEGENYLVNEYVDSDVHYLFLPNCCNTECLQISSSVELLSASNGEITNDGYAVNGNFVNGEEIVLQTIDGDEIKLVIMKSKIPSVCISLNGVTQETINRGSKETKYEGNDVFITNEKAEIDVQTSPENKIEVKGRGNYTWEKNPKKPYQIKFDEKTGVLGMTKAKKWVLLAQHDDVTMLRDNVVMWIAQNMKMRGTPNQEMVDLWIDGNYQGLYTLSQKLDSNKSSLNLKTDGLLVELDNVYYGSENPKEVFTSSVGNHFVLKETNLDEGDPIVLFSQFREKVDAFESLLYADEKDWDAICKIIDEESFAKYYLIEEFGANWDGMCSSTFMYCDYANDELHIGPIWDSCLMMGITSTAVIDKDYLISGTERKERATYYSELIKIKGFRDCVNRIYNEEFKLAANNAEARLETEKQRIMHSANMNYIRWPGRLIQTEEADWDEKYCNSYCNEVNKITDWMTARFMYFDSILPVADITKYDASLNQTQFEYDGNVKKPVVAIDNWLEGVDFTCEYDADCASVGSHTVKVNGINRCEGSFVLQYSIVPASVVETSPVENVSLSQPGAAIKNPSRGKKALTVKWKKPAKKYKKKINGYQIQYSTDKYFNSNIGVANVKKYNVTSKKINNLQKKTKYYVRVRSYSNTYNGPCYSYWSKTKSVKTK